MKNVSELAQFLFAKLAKGSRFEMFEDTYEVYNTSEGLAHAVKVSRKTGEKMNPSKSTLTNINLRMVELGIQTGKLVIL